MRSVFGAMCSCAYLLMLAGATAAEPTAEPRFVSMFDGRSLKGWYVSPASAANAWTVQDGMIVGEGDKGRSYLVYDQAEIADFELELEYRFPDKGNSGISIRAREDPTRKRDYQSYHADLGHVGIGKHILGAWDFHTPGRREHGCFRGQRLVIDQDDNASVTALTGAVTLDDIQPHGWNRVRVVATDNTFSFSINGKPAAEFVEHLDPQRRLDKGLIQLQLHDPGMVVHFKNLRIKVFK